MREALEELTREVIEGSEEVGERERFIVCHSLNTYLPRADTADNLRDGRRSGVQMYPITSVL